MGAGGSTCTPGPFRPATAAGAFVTMVEFFEIAEKRDSLSASQSWVEQKQVTAGGYTMTVACKIHKDFSDQVSLTFGVALRSGEWDDYVEWPFSKTVTFTVPHLVDYYKDLKLPISLEGDNVVRKPKQGWTNSARWSERLYWDNISRSGFLRNNVLRVNVEVL
ncbi:hypothetical protein HPB50_009428 [Hyalomma asiaticum]|uniref:Uncharacterized protein n=1 Tax=Hyalomma asiaticum TaxID=266040 RepID=A0ACB7RSQ6_HYAAI|nr:hypothetical protein HPB50_009428 [Hyalomma asiaticum]